MVSKNQTNVVVTAHDPTRNTQFMLTNSQQLDALERAYTSADIASVDVQFTCEKETLGGTTRHIVTNKHFGSLKQFLAYARLRYI